MEKASWSRVIISIRRLFFLIFIYANSVFCYALSADMPVCKEEIIMAVVNLDKVFFPNRLYLSTELENLLQQSEEDAYTLSMPLIVSAQLGNQSLYEQSLIRMNKAMDKLENTPFKAWLYGRILFAAHSIKDKQTETKTKTNLDLLLDNLVKNNSTGLDRFTVWSRAYLAALDKVTFTKEREPMVLGANYLTDAYLKMNASNESNEKKQESRSDALWAWVMIAQAAANAHEKVVYENAITQMMRISNQSSIGDALSKGLLRTSASNDYPAWALGIVRMASQTMGDEALYAALEPVLQTSINDAKLGNNIAETLLSMVNAELIVERQNQFEHCAGFKPY